jgi:enterochelin esterase-like enzyme
MQQDIESEESHKGGAYVRDLMADIIQYIEAHYNVIKKKDSRALADLSMRGISKLYTTAHFPETFGYVGGHYRDTRREFTKELAPLLFE